MKLSEYKNDLYTFTGTLSDINRQIAFAGIALIWIFKKTNGGESVINSELVFPAILLASSLGVDMLQYIYQSIAWAIFHRKHEKIKTEDDPELLASPYMNYPSWFLFSIKVILVIIAYIWIIDFLVDKLIK
jgi:hypothetical protein